MAKELEIRFKECLEKGRIKKFSGAKNMCEKELRVAAGDLAIAEEFLEAARSIFHK